MKRAVFVLVVLVIVFMGLLSHQMGTIQAGLGEVSEKPDTTAAGYEYYDEKDASGAMNMAAVTMRPQKKKQLIKVDTREDSITVLVNRKYRLSRDYIPADLVIPKIRFSFYGVYEKSYLRKPAARALEKLFAAAEQKQIILKGVSGYRSYARQEQIYTRNITSRGSKATNLVSARPGSSEHQTGLAIDVSSEVVGCAIEESFGNTKDGQWLATHCHNYGYIIRYPKDKTDITGYSYEPWHIRYVGKNLAGYLYKHNLTLEEYYQTTTVDDMIKNPEGKIHDVAPVDKEEKQIKTAPTPNPEHQITGTSYSEPTKAPVRHETSEERVVRPTQKPQKTPKSKQTVVPDDDTDKSETAAPAQETEGNQDSSEGKHTNTAVPETPASDGGESEEGQSKPAAEGENARAKEDTTGTTETIQESTEEIP